MAEAADRVRYDVVVLAGGASTRMGGTDKTRLMLAGRTVLDRVLTTAAAGDPPPERLIVVGEERPVAVEVTWARERPPGGGPAAALAAALPLLVTGRLVLLAGDLPLVGRCDLDRLLAATAAHPGAVLTDPHGRRQWLCSAWSVEALQRAELAAGGSIGRALAALTPITVAAACSGSWLDLDSPEDLAAAQAQCDKVQP